MVTVTVALLGHVGRAHADCGCDQTVGLYVGAGIQTVDGSGWKAGQTVCLTAGARSALNLTNVKGAAGNPITIKNCGGLVNLTTSTEAGFQIAGSYFHITGAGDAGYAMGIRVNSSAPGDNAMQVVGQSTDFEIDHLEVAGATYAGIMAKSDPMADCDPAYTRPTATFITRNMSLHDLYVHDTMTGEGLYLGDSFYNGTDVYDDGSSKCPTGTVQYPTELRGVRVFNVHTHNTGREAIQLGSATQDVEIHDNLCELYGQGGLAGQMGGIQMGVGTTGRLYNNVILGGKGEAIVLQGIGDDYVYNNVVVGNGGVAVSVNVRPTPLATDIVNKGFLGGVYIVDNTLVDTNDEGAIIEYVNAAQGNIFADNFIVSSAAKWNQLYTYTSWTVDHNVVLPSPGANAGFVDAPANDYALTASSPARGQGRDVSALGVTVDAAGIPRPAQSPDVGAHQYLAPGMEPPAPHADLGSGLADAAVEVDAATGDSEGVTANDDLGSAELPDMTAVASPDMAEPVVHAAHSGCSCSVGSYRNTGCPDLLSLLGLFTVALFVTLRSLRKRQR